MPTLPIDAADRGRVWCPCLRVEIPTTPRCTARRIYAREDVELDRATLADWVGQAVFLLTPLAEAIGRHIRAGVALYADDTRPGARPRPWARPRPAAVGRGARRAVARQKGWLVRDR